MAEKILKGINFPGLEDTYIIPQGAGVKVSGGGEIFNNYDNNEATGLYAHAEGSSTRATGSASHAEGNGAKALGVNSHAEGKGSEAHGADSHAEGRYAKAYGEGSHAEGNNSEAHELFSHAEGYRTRARGVYSHAEGDSAEANGRQSHAEGASTKALGSASHAEGSKTEAHQYGSHSEGGYSKATGGSAHAEGGHYKVFDETGAYTDMGGGGTLASGNASHAEGSSTIASGKFAHASGYGTMASGEASYSAGEGILETCGTGSGASGSTLFTFESTPSKTLNVGDHLVFTRPDGMSRERNIIAKNSSTEYQLDDDLDNDISYVVYKLAYNIASGKGARSVGMGTTASGEFSVAEGYKTTAQGSYSHAEGLHSKATVEGAHAEGYQTEATGKYAHSEGRTAKAQGYCSHAEGFGTTVSADYGHTEGNTAVASARAAHAEGEQTTAAGQRSHAEGYYTKATADAQHVQGRYNIEDTAKTYAHIVGNGNSTKRSNAHTIDWNGNANFAGDVYVGNANENKAGNKLATESFVTDKISEAELDIDLSGYATKDDVSAVSSLVGDTSVSSQISSAINSITPSSIGAAASSHNHSASNITSGTLDVARGGTGVTANPSMLTNLGSTTAASVFAASPRPGVTGTLPIANGGTGTTTAAAARTALGAASTSVATTSANGLMSSGDKTKLDGIATGANKYTLPNATSSTLGGVKVGSNITNSSGTISLTSTNVINALGYTPATAYSAIKPVIDFTGSMTIDQESGEPYVIINHNYARIFVVNIVKGSTNNTDMQSVVFGLHTNDYSKAFTYKLKVIDGNVNKIIELSHVANSNTVQFTLLNGSTTTFTITRILGYA